MFKSTYEKRKCPKCKHEWDEQTNKPEPINAINLQGFEKEMQKAVKKFENWGYGKMAKKEEDFDLWEISILKYLGKVKIPLTVRMIAVDTMMSPVTAKKKLKGLELKGKVERVKIGTRTKFKIKQEKINVL